MTIATLPLLGEEQDFLVNNDVATLNAHLARMFDLREHLTDREIAEQFIHQCFFRAYGANIQHFMPRLLSLCSKNGNRIAAFGMRNAEQGDLFLEQYLGRPVEQVMQQRLQQPLQRRHIVEIGNLSAAYPGAARWLIVALTAMLYKEGFSWVVFTATRSLHNGFYRLGLQPIELGVANLANLPVEERPDWGSYYDHTPKVLACNVNDGYQSLLQRRNLSALLRAGLRTVDSQQQV